MKYILMCGLLAMYLAFTTTIAESSDYKYALFDLGDLGGNASNAFGINDEGVVVGNAWLPDNWEYHAVAFANGKVYDLGTFGGSRSWAYEINNDNLIAGVSYYPEPEKSRAFLFEDRTMIDIGTLGGIFSGATSINEQKQIVGNAHLYDESYSHAFRWQDGIMTDLGTLIGDDHFSSAWDINEVGQIIGYSSSDNSWTAVLWQPDNELIDLGGLCELCESKAYAINDLGNIIGWSENAKGNNVAVLWDEQGNIQNLQPPSSDFRSSSPWGINNQDQIVGGGETKDYKYRGFYIDLEVGMIDLEELVPPNKDMVVVVGYDINEHGQIAGWGEMNGTGWYRAILLTPVEPELSLSDPSPGIAGQTNTWIVTQATPFADVTLAYSLKGGGTVIPGCDTLDAVIQMDKPQVIQTVAADADGVARFEIFVVNQASNFANGILFQAASVNECEESQLKLFVFE